MSVFAVVIVVPAPVIVPSLDVDSILAVLQVGHCVSIGIPVADAESIPEARSVEYFASIGVPVGDAESMPEAISAVFEVISAVHVLVSVPTVEEVSVGKSFDQLFSIEPEIRPAALISL
ncbi:MAG: hypothetical protein GY696_26240 [Gammaproteobacteria bacterium]|nr:hypothetical protein [Gammaproteobacteria bacterium]